MMARARRRRRRPGCGRQGRDGGRPDTPPRAPPPADGPLAADAPADATQVRLIAGGRFLGDGETIEGRAERGREGSVPGARASPVQARPPHPPSLPSLLQA